MRVHGFSITKDSTSIHCNRRGTIDRGRNYVGGRLGVGCNFHVKIKALSKDRSHRPDKTVHDKSKFQYLNL